MTPDETTQRRFFSKVAEDAAGCWLWTSALDLRGYAKFWFMRRNVSAYRWSYEFFVCAVPEGLELDHLCRVRRCVNPAHLEPVTHRENCRRRDVANV